MDKLRSVFSWALASCLCGAVAGQTLPDKGDGSGSSSKEEFVNEVCRTVVDSSFGTYRLSSNAYPCSFLKFEYDEWVKYALLEEVPVYILNELAAKSFADRSPASWKPGCLVDAVSIDEEKIDSVLDPSVWIEWNRKTNHKQTRSPAAVTPPTAADNAAALKTWQKLPAEQRTVFYFSRPLITDDGNYAILDMSYRCDNRVCGTGFTCLFHKNGKGWRLAGKKQNW